MCCADAANAIGRSNENKDTIAKNIIHYSGRYFTSHTATLGVREYSHHHDNDNHGNDVTHVQSDSFRPGIWRYPENRV
jgi:hypothetical protein